MPENKLVEENKQIRQLRKWGYRVEQAQGPDYDDDGNEIFYTDSDGKEIKNPPIIMWVEQPHPNEDRGQIFGNYVRLDDDDAWARLSNPLAHQYRIDYARHDDPDDKFTLDDTELLNRSLEVQVALGDTTKKEATKILAMAEDSKTSK